MSDFRIFCIGTVIGMGLSATASNHGWLHFNYDPVATVVGFGAFLGCMATTLFGGRARER